MCVHTPTEGYRKTGVFGVCSRNAYPAMSLDKDKFASGIQVHRYFEEMSDLENGTIF